MKLFKRIFVALVIVGLPGFAAADEWVANKLDNGEIVYKSGHYDKLYFGSRGVGFITTQAMHSEESAYVVVDDGKPIFSQLDTPATRGIYLFKNSKELAPLVMKGKKVEIRFSTCGSHSKIVSMDCFYAKAGDPYSVGWEFQKPLADVINAAPMGN